ncbi:MAG TPA: LptE family protein [Thermoanaerobaculia bacterium]|nr:LptE family protein [Thermoanaerobaculia bacterium]
MKRASLIVVLCFTFMLSGCGYSLVGRGNFLPPSIRSILVPTFVNRTTRVEVEQQITQAVAAELVFRGRLQLVSSLSDADAILRGEVQSFGITPVAFNEQGRATQYQVSITAQIELLDHRNDDAVIWKNNQYRFLETYPIDVSATDAFDQETRAIDDIARRFAERLVTNLLEGF